MIINDKPRAREVKFCDVPNGEVFMGDGVYYLAIEEIQNDLEYCKNAVDLNGGKVTYFDSDEMVTWVKATLTVENR